MERLIKILTSQSRRYALLKLRTLLVSLTIFKPGIGIFPECPDRSDEYHEE